jgi:asparagine synthase (glutamine-hydrolysing)
MCGIAGYRGPNPPADEAVRRTLALMRRRGPDDQSARRFPLSSAEITLLHARLSIIDLVAASNQPLQVGNGWIVYNGELYNYVELRAALEAEGVTFRTKSDTEVLVRVLLQWGWQGLDRCEGMWAFAFHDAASGKLILSRDRFGEKPLFLRRGEQGELWFGSEPKFIASLSGKPLAPNADHVARFLVNGYKALYKSNHTFFKDVEELKPGYVLEIDADGRTREFPYWKPKLGPEADMSFQEAVAGTRERLIRSMEMRMRADVPLAFCMSGGVDSNACISIASRVLGQKVRGFTIVNTDERYEEQDIIAAAVDELDVDHTEVHLSTKGFREGMIDLVKHHDAPVYTISYYVHWLLQRAISSAGYRISISGTAADELFTGYYDHHNFYLAAVADDSDLHGRSLGAWRKHIAPLVRNPFLKDPDIFRKLPLERRHIFLDADVFAGFLTRPWHEAFAETVYTEVPLRNRMLNELFHESIPVILHEDDSNAMFYSVENRSPFLDRDLFEFSTQIPTHHLIRDGAAKAVLREAIRGIAPDVVVNNRRKVGFNAPIQDLVDTDDPETRKWILADGPIYELVDRDKIITLMSDDRLSNSRSKLLFSFLSSRIFLDACA